MMATAMVMIARSVSNKFLSAEWTLVEGDEKWK
jgi:hypothetical protein